MADECPHTDTIVRIDERLKNIEQDCEEKKNDIKHIENNVIPNIYEKSIKPLDLRVRILENWQNWSIGYAVAITGATYLAYEYFKGAL